MVQEQRETFPNAHLIGVPHAGSQLNTPFLALDLPKLGRNVASMAHFAGSRGIALRPHAKTHKCLEIARMQIDAGAVGICCAKLGEAEIFARGGISDILITSPIVGQQAVLRLAKLAQSHATITTVVDSVQSVEAIASHAREAGARINILIDIDPGMNRTGVVEISHALAVADAVTSSAALKLRGIQFYCGQEQHIESYEDRRRAICQRTARLTEFLKAFRDTKIAIDVVSGSGTGTHEIDADLGVIGEFQAGSYTVMDDQYEDCALRSDCARPFETALSVGARVISANVNGRATLDAGLKSFATEGKAPRISDLRFPGASFIFRGDEHGQVILPAGSNGPQLGELVRLSAPHCDPTINLHDGFHVMDGDTLVDIWPVSARGKSA